MQQNSTLWTGIERPKKYINRPAILEKIRHAIYPNDALCHVVLIKGSGGMGKTRLLEEVMSRLGSDEMRRLYPMVEEDWSAQYLQQAVVGRLFDFIHIYLHTRNSFLSELGKVGNWGNAPNTNFRDFQAADTRLTRKLDAGTSLATMQEAEREMLDAFWRDYHQATLNQRLVIPLDTAEQLSLLDSKWLEEQKLLTAKDLEKNIQEWLIHHIAVGDFAKTTFLIAGREKEGQPFFDKIEAALKVSPHCRFTIITAEPFSLDEISQFCLALAEDSEKSEVVAEQTLASDFRELAQDRERLAVLKIFTEGQPVRLALYTDVLFEGHSIPEPLRLSLPEAQQIEQNYDKLKEAQRQIEREFVNMLFRRPTLRSQILLALVRATRGLNTYQLHYILYSKHNRDAEKWDVTLAMREYELKDVENELDSLVTLSIVKPKNRFETNKKLQRYGLQDEVYRIYNDSMRDEQSRRAEKKERRILYEKIIAWLKPQRDKSGREQQQLIGKQLERIDIERPEKILASQIPPLSRVETEKLTSLSYQLVDLDLEYLHYQLLLDPNTHFNDTYFDLGYNKNTARELVEGALFQAEVTRTLNEPHTTDLIDWPSSAPGSLLEAIQRMIVQSSVARWLLIFAMHGRPQRTIELFHQIEDKIATLDPVEREEWQSIGVKAERLCWYVYALSLTDQYDEALALLEEHIPELEKLAPSDYTPTAEEELFEYRGTAAEKRIIFLVAEMYNTWGYILTQLGRFQQAVTYYTKAQQRLRYAGGFHTQMAYVLNNQARALAEMGLKRAERICLDGLELRLQEGTLIPIALSYNTLGLMYNLFHRAQEALGATARAYAIAKLVGDERTLGLVYTQLAISLRRLVSQQKRKYRFSAESEAIYQQADTALRYAAEQFQRLRTDQRPSLRLIEVDIELGCLYRDWPTLDDDMGEETLNRYFYQAESYLKQAIQEAEKGGLDRLLLDAQVNLVWLYARHGYENERDKMFVQIKNTVSRIAPTAFFEPNQDPPQPNDDEKDYRPHFIFQQLNKIESFRGRIAMQQFQRVAEDLRGLPPATRAPYIADRNRWIAQAARSFAFASSYAALFAPNSHALTLVYNDLYEHAKKFNPLEMYIYYREDKRVRDKYRLNRLRPLDAGDTRSFLMDNFGDYYEEDEKEGDEG